MRVSTRQPRLAEGFEHHRFGRHAAGVRIAASAEAVVVEAAHFGIDIHTANLDSGATEKSVLHRLGLGGDVQHANGRGNLLLRQNLPQACDRTRSVGSTAGF